MSAFIVLLALSELIGFALASRFLGLQSRHPAQGSRFFHQRLDRSKRPPDRRHAGSAAALKALEIQALQSDVNDRVNEWGHQALLPPSLRQTANPHAQDK
jgi:hypothetical protein